MSNLDALSVCERLEADKSLATLFDILRDYGDAPAALWLKGEQELSCTYAEMALRADDYAACIAQLAPEEGWIGVAVDTCHDWPSLYCTGASCVPVTTPCCWTRPLRIT